jgi:hypothetical protein
MRTESVLHRSPVPASRFVFVGLLLAGLTSACSSSSKPASPPSTVTTRPPTVPGRAPTSFAELADRIITRVPPGYVQQPFKVGDTGPSDLAKAVRDDGSPNAAQFLRTEGFARGFQQLWVDGQKRQIIVFLYQFKTSDGARRDFERGAASYGQKVPAGMHVQRFSLQGMPTGRSLGLAASDKTGSAALVFFTTGVYNVQIDANETMPNAPLSPLQQLGTALAQDQLSRL